MNLDPSTVIPSLPNYVPHQPYPWVRRLYAVLLYLLVPLLPVYLLLRARKQPEYRLHWAERFACYKEGRIAAQSRRIWLHAVSLGETRATKPLVDALLARYSDIHIILTCHTPTGRAAGQELFRTHLDEGRMTQVYVPYDLNPLLNHFFKAFAPTDVWVMETEIWPNMIAQCVQRNIPISLINGRLSEKTLRQANKWPKLMGNAYAGFSRVCAQTDTDAQRYRQIGVVDEQLVVAGNLKFDMVVPVAQVEQGEGIRQLLPLGKRVVLLASSREGEEALWFDAICQYEKMYPQEIVNTQWWVAPRHPQRFDEVAQLLQASGKVVLRKSEWLKQMSSESLKSADFVLGDTMGEMFSYYALADVVLMGGTWRPYGGQNFLEPMALGRPILVGESIYNFEEIGRDAIGKGVLWQVKNFNEALQMLRDLRALPLSERERMFDQKINLFVRSRLGASRNLLNVLMDSYGMVRKVN